MLTKEEYLTLKGRFDSQLEQVERSIAGLREEMRQYRQSAAAESQFVQHFLKYRNIRELTREVVVELIEMIYVHEGGTITILFQYQDEYQRLLDLLDEHGLSAKAG